MSLQKVVTKRKSAKLPLPTCFRCKRTIMPGETYHLYYASFRGAVRTHCKNCLPNIAERESNSTLQPVRQAQMDLEEAILKVNQFDTSTPNPTPTLDELMNTLMETLDSAVETVEEAKNEVESTMENCAEGSSPHNKLQATYERLEAYQEGLESAKSEMDILWEALQEEYHGNAPQDISDAPPVSPTTPTFHERVLDIVSNIEGVGYEG